MATPIKCQAFFQSDAGKGWSEVHWIEGGSPVGPLLPYMQAFKTLLESKRLPLLASDCFLKGLRVSYTDIGVGVRSSPFRYAPVKYPANDYSGASPSIAAKVRMGAADNSQFSDIYLRGFWDAVEHDEELDFTTLEGDAWNKLLGLYTKALVQNGYGWFAQDDALTNRGQITGYSIDVDGFVSYTVNVQSGPGMGVAGSIHRFRPAQLNGSKSILNTEQSVKVVDATHVITTRPRAALPFESAGIYTMPGWSFTPYTGVQYTILARKPMGAPFFQSAARAKARPLG